MASVRSLLLGYGALSTGVLRSVFTVPGGNTVLVKSVYGQNYSAGVTSLLVRARVPPAAADVVQVIEVAYAKSYTWHPWLALPQFAELLLEASPAGPLTYAVSGALLPGVVSLGQVIKPAGDLERDGGA